MHILAVATCLLQIRQFDSEISVLSELVKLLYKPVRNEFQ
jgi:hypothetical protein